MSCKPILHSALLTYKSGSFNLYLFKYQFSYNKTSYGVRSLFLYFCLYYKIILNYNVLIIIEIKL